MLGNSESVQGLDGMTLEVSFDLGFNSWLARGPEIPTPYGLSYVSVSQREES